MTQSPTATAHPRREVEPGVCPRCGEYRLVDLDLPRRRFVCLVCSAQWPIGRRQLHA